MNQPPPLDGYDVYGADLALVEAVRREGDTSAETRLHELGRLAGSAEAIAWGFDANRYPPVLRTHDRFGERLDEVDFHPSYHRLLETAAAYGLHAAPWATPVPGAHVARAAGFFVWTQVDAGHGCPVSMTYAAIPTLRMNPDLAARWEPLLAARTYDPALRPAAQKHAALCGMAMTERQGGSDVRANTTRATPLGAGRYLLDGHKWFCSAPMSDAFLVLAQAPEGLSCFWLPRVLEDGAKNAMRIERLKEKLGNRSNASSEVRFEDAEATIVGEPGRGVATIIEMVAGTRLDCIVGSAAGMRHAVAQATHHAAYRSAFGRRLAEQPAMTNVLADLALESEAATAVAMRLAGACDRASSDPHEALFRRVAVPVAKFAVCKRAPAHAAEALECLGGNGFVEESIMPRLYREAPLNGIWEGSGNVQALDVLRAGERTPLAYEAYLDEVYAARGADARLDAEAARLRDLLRSGDLGEAMARSVADAMYVALAASLLVRHAPPAVADAYVGSRIAVRHTLYGSLSADAGVAAIVARATPER